MSTYYSIWIQTQLMQERTITILAVIGAGLAVGWLVMGAVIPAKWLPLAQRGYIMVTALIGLYAMFITGRL